LNPAPTPLYDQLGQGYAAVRRPDARIMQQLLAALGEARSVINVGAGTGSYEPTDRPVVAVEPSAEMITQRPAGAAPCVRAYADALPFGDRSFDAGLAVLTLHHWPDPYRGIAELSRVCRARVVLLTCDISCARSFWMVQRYLPEVAAIDGSRFPPIERLVSLFPRVRTEVVPIPHDCTDGFFGAYWRRPRSYLDPAVRAGISVLRQLDEAVVARALAELERDLETGAWDEQVARHLPDAAIDLGYRLVVGELG
jgi:SAM-dependent methyltransferase